MELSFATATVKDAAGIVDVRNAAAEDLHRRFGPGFWSHLTTENGVLRGIGDPRFSRTLVGRRQGRLVAVLTLVTKKPWAIDTAYFTAVKRPLYLIGMAVDPALQKQGIGRRLLQEAEAVVRAWPGDAIRLDAFDAAAGAGLFYAKCGYHEVGRVVYRTDALVYFELIL